MLKTLLVLAMSMMAGTCFAGALLLLGAGNSGTSTPAPTGKILLVDGVSFLLLVDNTSKLCRAGGC